MSRLVLPDVRILLIRLFSGLIGRAPAQEARYRGGWLFGRSLTGFSAGLFRVCAIGVPRQGMSSCPIGTGYRRSNPLFGGRMQIGVLNGQKRASLPASASGV
jgi:hypothetical protein